MDLSGNSKIIPFESKTNSRIVSFAQDVFAYLHEVQKKISLGQFGDKGDKPADAGGANVSFIDILSAEIIDNVNRRIENLKNDRRFNDPKIINDILFAFVALIDEILIFKNWSGKDAWSKSTLESRIFKSQSAGEMFYEKCSRIMNDRDPISREIAYVYFMCLSAGFKGKNHTSASFNNIEKVKTELFFFYNENNENIRMTISPFLNQEELVQENTKRKIVNNKKIKNVLLLLNLIVFCLFFAISYVFWEVKVKTVENFIVKIKEQKE